MEWSDPSGSRQRDRLVLGWHTCRGCSLPQLRGRGQTIDARPRAVPGPHADQPGRSVRAQRVRAPFVSDVTPARAGRQGPTPHRPGVPRRRRGPAKVEPGGSRPARKFGREDAELPEGPIRRHRRLEAGAVSDGATRYGRFRPSYTVRPTTTARRDLSSRPLPGKQVRRVRRDGSGKNRPGKNMSRTPRPRRTEAQLGACACSGTEHSHRAGARPRALDRHPGEPDDPLLTAVRGHQEQCRRCLAFHSLVVPELRRLSRMIEDSSLGPHPWTRCGSIATGFRVPVASCRRWRSGRGEIDDVRQDHGTHSRHCHDGRPSTHRAAAGRPRPAPAGASNWCSDVVVAIAVDQPGDTLVLEQNDAAGVRRRPASTSNSFVAASTSMSRSPSARSRAMPSGPTGSHNRGPPVLAALLLPRRRRQPLERLAGCRGDNVQPHAEHGIRRDAASFDRRWPTDHVPRQALVEQEGRQALPRRAPRRSAA